MTTCGSTTCPMQRPYLRLTFSITTQILSLLWPKSCIQGATSPTWPIILCGCSTIRGNFCECTRKTSTAWKDVCILTFFQPISCSFIRQTEKRSTAVRLLRLCLVAGIPPEMLVEAHGTFATATCTVCLRKYEGQQLRVSYTLPVP